LCNVEWYMGGQKYDFEKYSENFVDWWEFICKGFLCNSKFYGFKYKSMSLFMKFLISLEQLMDLTFHCLCTCNRMKALLLLEVILFTTKYCWHKCVFWDYKFVESMSSSDNLGFIVGCRNDYDLVRKLPLMIFCNKLSIWNNIYY
jgi:hypothetical protein